MLNKFLSKWLDAFKVENPTLFIVIVSVLVAIYGGIEYATSQGAAPSWLSAILPYLKWVFGIVGISLNSSTAPFRSKASIVLLLFLVGGFGVHSLSAQNQNKTSLPRTSYYSVSELRDAFNGAGQIAFATLFNKPSNRTKSITPKYIHNDSLLIVFSELLGSSGGGGSDNQTLSINGNQVSIRDGNSITLPSTVSNRVIVAPTQADNYQLTITDNSIQSNNGWSGTTAYIPDDVLSVSIVFNTVSPSNKYVFEIINKSESACFVRTTNNSYSGLIVPKSGSSTTITNTLTTLPPGTWRVIIANDFYRFIEV